MRWLPYLHPALMIAVLALALFVLREGLGIRRGRLLGSPVDSRRHRRFARILVGLVSGGFVLGLVSLGWLRGRPLGQSAHFALVTGSAGLLCLGAVLGLRLERGAPAPVRTLHALCGAGAVLLALCAAIAGLAILP